MAEALLAATRLAQLVEDALRRSGCAQSVDRDRVRPLPEGIATAVDVYLTRSDSAEFSSGRMYEATTSVSLVFRARAVGDALPTDALDPIIFSGLSAVRSDASVIAFVTDIHPPKLVFEGISQIDLSERIGACTVLMTFKHRTNRDLQPFTI